MLWDRSHWVHGTTNLIAPSAAASAIDNGPQDGTFDAFIDPGHPSINKNGSEDIRNALEFDLGSVPPLAHITAAILIVAVDSSEGFRLDCCRRSTLPDRLCTKQLSSQHNPKSSSSGR
jgi:hypothetical protein